MFLDEDFLNKERQKFHDIHDDLQQPLLLT